MKKIIVGARCLVGKCELLLDKLCITRNLSKHLNVYCRLKQDIT